MRSGWWNLTDTDRCYHLFKLKTNTSSSAVCATRKKQNEQMIDQRIYKKESEKKINPNKIRFLFWNVCVMAYIWAKSDVTVHNRYENELYCAKTMPNMYILFDQSSIPIPLTITPDRRTDGRSYMVFSVILLLNIDNVASFSLMISPVTLSVFAQQGPFYNN